MKNADDLKNQQLELVVKALKLTTNYKLNQLEIVEDLENQRIEVYSINHQGERENTFFATNLCIISEILSLGSYVCSDKQGKCHLEIY